MYRFLVLSVVAIALIGCGTSEPSEPVVDIEDQANERDYDVYSAIVNRFNSGGTKEHIWIINTAKRARSGLPAAVDEKRPFDSDDPRRHATNELVTRISDSTLPDWDLKREFTVTVAYDLGEEPVPSLIGQLEYWPEFYRLFPNSIGKLDVSPVAYSADGKFAVVFVFYHCDLRCASFDLYVIERSDGGAWKVVSLDNYGVS